MGKSGKDQIKRLEAEIQRLRDAAFLREQDVARMRDTHADELSRARQERQNDLQASRARAREFEGLKQRCADLMAENQELKYGRGQKVPVTTGGEIIIANLKEEMAAKESDHTRALAEKDDEIHRLKKINTDVARTIGDVTDRMFDLKARLGEAEHDQYLGLPPPISSHDDHDVDNSTSKGSLEKEIDHLRGRLREKETECDRMTLQQSAKSRTIASMLDHETSNIQHWEQIQKLPRKFREMVLEAADRDQALDYFLGFSRKFQDATDAGLHNARTRLVRSSISRTTAAHYDLMTSKEMSNKPASPVSSTAAQPGFPQHLGRKTKSETWGAEDAKPVTMSTISGNDQPVPKRKTDETSETHNVKSQIVSPPRPKQQCLPTEPKLNVPSSALTAKPALPPYQSSGRNIGVWDGKTKSYVLPKQQGAWLGPQSSPKVRESSAVSTAQDRRPTSSRSQKGLHGVRKPLISKPPTPPPFDEPVARNNAADEPGAPFPLSEEEQRVWDDVDAIMARFPQARWS